MSKVSNPYRISLNLQLFGEEDAILPDDFTAAEPTTVQEPTEPSEPIEPVTEPTEPTTVQESVQTQTPLLKVKFNHEEREIPYDEAIPLVQKGMNYDKLQEKLQTLEANPVLPFLEQLAGQYGMTPEQWMEAVKQEQDKARLDELIQQNIPEDLAQEILSNRQFRQKWEAEQQAKADAEKKQAEDMEFLEYFTQATGKPYDQESNKVPDEAMKAHLERGIPLKQAFMEWQVKSMADKIKILEQNAKNAGAAPVGSVTTHGGSEPAAEDDFLRGFNSI